MIKGKNFCDADRLKVKTFVIKQIALWGFGESMLKGADLGLKVKTFVIKGKILFEKF